MDLCRSATIFICGLLASVSAGSSKNPFLDQKFYINPVNSKEFDASIATATGITKVNLQKMQRVPSAYWIDRAIKIRGQTTTTVEGILKDASSKSTPELVVLMFYDLPNRDCDAKASNGEICCKKGSDGRCDYLAPGDCSDGLHEYKTSYVDPFVAVLSAYDGRLPMVLVMEPDGLANLATNIAHPKCGNEATQTAYKEGVSYAVEQITSKAPSVTIYLDAAHGGWLGWANNLEMFMKMLKSLSLPFHKIRGFATNVANYQALGVQCPWCPDQGFRNGYCMNGKHSSDPCCADPCKLISQWNFGNNELNYAAGLVAAANSVLGMDAHVIIDTGRNGVTDQRQDCANWCNPRGAGTGMPSTTKTANTSLVDAYFWLKTPGESDGCSETLPTGKKCARFDAMCASVDSLGTKDGEPAAVEAGMWFDFQVKQLAENAVFDPPESAGEEGNCSGTPVQQPPPMMPILYPTSPHSTLNSSSSSSSSGGPCAPAYQQCGGHGWVGPSCCQDGCTCTDNGGGYYSQCTPADPSMGGSCSKAGGSSPVTPLGGNVVQQPLTTTLRPSGSSTRPRLVPATQGLRARSTTTAQSSNYINPTYAPVPATTPSPTPAPQTSTQQQGGSYWQPAPAPSSQPTYAPPPVASLVPNHPVWGSTNTPSPSGMPAYTYTPSAFPAPLQPSYPTLAPLLPGGTFAPQPQNLLGPTLAPKSTSTAPAPTPKPTPYPTPSPPTPNPTPPTQSQSQQQQCSAPYAGCGGSSWTGPTCCQKYCICERVDDSKSICVPSFAVTDDVQVPQTGMVRRDSQEGIGLMSWAAGGLLVSLAAVALVRRRRACSTAVPELLRHAGSGMYLCRNLGLSPTGS